MWGQNTGIPIKKCSDNEKINEMITEYDKLNDVGVFGLRALAGFQKVVARAL